MLRGGILFAAILIAWCSAATAQSLSIDLGNGGSVATTTLQLIAVITLLSIAPGLVIMITCFPFIVTVLAILRQAIGLQQSPPNMLIVSVALFLTFFVMEPVFLTAWDNGIRPLVNEEITPELGFERGFAPFREFMAQQTNPVTYETMVGLRNDPDAGDLSPDSPITVLVASFMLSEMSRAFQVGFLLFLPFLIIDLVVAAILMSMGMMMVPPVMVSLPFKLAFFVVSDGWSLVAESLVRSYQ